MGKVYFLLSILFFWAGLTFGQSPIIQSQYFQNGPANNPALTGVEDYWDVKAGFKQQWSGFEDAPRSMYLGAYGLLKKNQNYFNPRAYSLRISDPSQYESVESTDDSGRKAKHGIGAYLINDTQGAFELLSGHVNYAYHLPVGEEGFLSFGATLGLSNHKIDLGKVLLRDMDNDNTFNSLLNNGSSNTFFNTNLGISYYTPKYYLSYAIITAINPLVSGNEDVLQDSQAKHHVMLGYNWGLNTDFDLLPSAFLRMGENLPEEWMLNIKARYKGMYWAGLGYRNDGDIIGMLGFIFNDFIQFGYAYDMTTSNINDFNNGSHEIVLGLMLFNDNRSKPYFW